MPEINYNPIIRLIPKSTFSICHASGLTEKEIIKRFATRKNGAYYLDKFINHLGRDCLLSIQEYCEQYFQFKWPLCPIKNQPVGFKVTGQGLILREFKQGAISKKHSKNFNKFCERLSKERKGANNPMYGKKPWNKGLDNSDPRIKKNSKKRIGSKASPQTRQKQSIAAKKRKIHGHSGKKHSAATIEKLRLNTSKMWQNGRFNRQSSIHIKVRDFLIFLGVSFKEEFQVKYFSLDFAIDGAKVAIECQGSFFHVDPRLYPNGPICAIQRRNFGRDIAKKKVCCDQEGWIIIELWETEINDDSFKEFLKCELQKLNLLPR